MLVFRYRRASDNVKKKKKKKIKVVARIPASSVKRTKLAIIIVQVNRKN